MKKKFIVISIVVFGIFILLLSLYKSIYNIYIIKSDESAVKESLVNYILDEYNVNVDLELKDKDYYSECVFGLDSTCFYRKKVDDIYVYTFNGKDEYGTPLLISYTGKKITKAENKLEGIELFYINMNDLENKLSNDFGNYYVATNIKKSETIDKSHTKTVFVVYKGNLKFDDVINYSKVLDSYISRLDYTFIATNSLNTFNDIKSYKQELLDGYILNQKREFLVFKYLDENDYGSEFAINIENRHSWIIEMDDNSYKIRYK